MNHEDFPALCLAADEAAVTAESRLLKLQAWSSVLLIIGALTTVETSYRIVPVAGVLLFLGSLFLFVCAQYFDLQGRWYKSRALAESVKTVSWRWMMDADPFYQRPEAASAKLFRTLLDELLRENKDIGSLLVGDWSNREQMTDKMHELRRANLDVRKTAYLKNRIEDQRSWYTEKAKYNRNHSRGWFVVLCVVYSVAIVLLVLRVVRPDLPYWPIEVVAVGASAIMVWMQLKRFNELASAYSLTAHEIGIVNTRFASVTDEKSLAAFVSDAENAFSREHTQWAARRDHIGVR